jgi:hypothetical protein
VKTHYDIPAKGSGGNIVIFQVIYIPGEKSANLWYVAKIHAIINNLYRPCSRQYPFPALGKIRTKAVNWKTAELLEQRFLTNK